MVYIALAQLFSVIPILSWWFGTQLPDSSGLGLILILNQPGKKLLD